MDELEKYARLLRFKDSAWKKPRIFIYTVTCFGLIVKLELRVEARFGNVVRAGSGFILYQLLGYDIEPRIFLENGLQNSTPLDDMDNVFWNLSQQSLPPIFDTSLLEKVLLGIWQSTWEKEAQNYLNSWLSGVWTTEEFPDNGITWVVDSDDGLPY